MRSIPEKSSTKLLAIAATCAGYDHRQDPGGDVADAIGLGRWWVGRRKLAELAGAAPVQTWPPASLRRRGGAR